MNERGGLSRRSLLKSGILGVAGLAAGNKAVIAAEKLASTDPHDPSAAGTVGRVTDGSIDPITFLESFDYGRVTRRADGKVVREYDMQAIDREIEVAPGVFYPAWTFNGQVPGPTIRATSGDIVRINFHNVATHAHTIHFHGIHPANMDGVFEVVGPGESFVYEFEAKPFGVHLYHCHVKPIKKHMAKGLYGAFIIDPPDPRPPAREMVMLMNGFDTNFDGENEIYAANTIAFAYEADPIPVRKGQLQRLYLINITEFDPVNSFHLHGNMFHVYRTGTSMAPHDYTDTIMMCQGERHILEFTYDQPGRYLFHAHQAEFAELGWRGVFNVHEALA